MKPAKLTITHDRQLGSRPWRVVLECGAYRSEAFCGSRRVALSVVGRLLGDLDALESGQTIAEGAAT